jgi:hypothetical protein
MGVIDQIDSEYIVDVLQVRSSLDEFVLLTEQANSSTLSTILLVLSMCTLLHLNLLHLQHHLSQKKDMASVSLATTRTIFID